MKRKAAEKAHTGDLRMNGEAARQIRQHARASLKAEVCGVLIGNEDEGVTSVDACIPGANAVQGGSHVTFTQDTWEHIYRIKDHDYPEARIVGWYHSHPGFGVFLSDHDTFIHKNFFSSPRQVAWVYDPHSDEEGCFGWVGERLERLPRVVLVDGKGGERAGETGKPEPLLFDTGGESASEFALSAAPEASPSEVKAMLNAAGAILSYLCVLVIGFFICWFLFPSQVVRILVPVDPRTGAPLLNVPGWPVGGIPLGPNAGALSSPSAQPDNPTPPPQGAKGKP